MSPLPGDLDVTGRAPAGWGSSAGCCQARSPGRDERRNAPHLSAPRTGNPSLDFFTLPRWDRTYLGVFRSLTRRSPPRPRLFPWDADPLTPQEPLWLCPPGRCLCPFHSWAGTGSAPTCARARLGGGSQWVLPRATPQSGFWGGGSSPQPPSCTWQPLHPSSAPDTAAARGIGRPRRRKSRRGGGGKVFKSTKKEKKKNPPLLEIFFSPSWKHFQLYKCPDVGCTAPAPRSAPAANSQRCSSRGGRSAAGASLRLQRRHPTGTRLHPSITGKRRGGGGKKRGGGEGEIVSPKSIFFSF